MPNDFIRRGEFDTYKTAADQRMGRLEQKIDALDEEHGEDMDELAKAQAERSRWTWQQILAVIGTAAVLGGLWLQALAARH